jgi:hypothetical protein
MTKRENPSESTIITSLRQSRVHDSNLHDEPLNRITNPQQEELQSLSKEKIVTIHLSKQIVKAFADSTLVERSRHSWQHEK